MPIDETRVFDAFARLLVSGTASPLDLLRDTNPGDGLSPPMLRLLQSDIDLTIRAAEGGWPYPPEQFEVVVEPLVPLRYEVVLPPYFASLEQAEAFSDRTGLASPFHLYRLDVMIALVIDMLRKQELLLVERMTAALGPGVALRFFVATGDCSDAPGAVTMAHRRGGRGLLVPDPYFFNTEGYFDRKMAVLRRPLAWSERSDRVVWRGTSTGTPFTADDLMRNERVRMATLCNARPDLFDVRITGVCNVPAGTEGIVGAKLAQLGLLGEWTPMSAFAASKFALHIDGNASAWGLMEKLSMGLCVLKVDSPFEQWFEPRLAPWEHFVPIAADLSDLVDKAEFLRRNPALSERIARSAFEFALACDPVSEARAFVSALVRPVTHEMVLCAPAPGAAGAQSGWHDVEHPAEGRPYRWTGSRRMHWPIRADLSGGGRVRVTVPWTGEIAPGFHASCLVEFAGRRFPLVPGGQGLVAEVLIEPGDIVDAVTLHTPPPLTPPGGADSRLLGLAIATG